jgi:hypothetical protein
VHPAQPHPNITIETLDALMEAVAFNPLETEGQILLKLFGKTERSRLYNAQGNVHEEALLLKGLVAGIKECFMPYQTTGQLYKLRSYIGTQDLRNAVCELVWQKKYYPESPEVRGQVVAQRLLETAQKNQAVALQLQQQAVTLFLQRLQAAKKQAKIYLQNWQTVYSYCDVVK